MKTKKFPAITSITDNSGGTASKTVAAIGSSYSQTEVRNAIASILATQEEILDVLRKTNGAGIIND